MSPVGWCQLKYHVEDNSLVDRAEHPINSISMRCFGSDPRINLCGFGSERTISYYSGAKTCSRPNIPISGNLTNQVFASRL